METSIANESSCARIVTIREIKGCGLSVPVITKGEEEVDGAKELDEEEGAKEEDMPNGLFT